MTTAAPPSYSHLEITVTPDRSRALVCLKTGYPECPVADVRAALGARGILLDEEAEARLRDCAVDGRFASATPVTVVEAVAPVDDQPARLRLLEKAAEKGAEEEAERAAVDHRARSHLRLATAGMPVAEMIPYSKGQDGVDVYGRSIGHKSLPLSRVTLGKNVSLAADGRTVVALVDGQVCTERFRIWVEPRLAIQSDVDYGVGNVDFKGHVDIDGSVLDLFEIRASGDVNVGKMLEAAQVWAGGQLTVGGGIVGKQKGQCTAGGSITARFANNAHLVAGGDVVIQHELINSRVVCRGALNVDGGIIAGGHCTAVGAVRCGTLGSPGQVMTLIECGVDQALRDDALQLPDLEARRKAAARIQTEVAPLLKNAARLTAQQKEKATELLYEASEIEKQVSERITAWRARLAAMMEADATVIVTERLYPGVVVRFRGVEARVDEELRGPVRIGTASEGGVRCIIATHTITGSVRRLPAHAWADGPLEAITALLAAQTA